MIYWFLFIVKSEFFATENHSFLLSRCEKDKFHNLYFFHITAEALFLCVFCIGEGCKLDNYWVITSPLLNKEYCIVLY